MLNECKVIKDFWLQVLERLQPKLKFHCNLSLGILICKSMYLTICLNPKKNFLIYIYVCNDAIDSCNW